MLLKLLKSLSLLSLLELLELVELVKEMGNIGCRAIEQWFEDFVLGSSSIQVVVNEYGFVRRKRSQEQLEMDKRACVRIARLVVPKMEKLEKQRADRRRYVNRKMRTKVADLERGRDKTKETYDENGKYVAERHRDWLDEQVSKFKDAARDRARKQRMERERKEIMDIMRREQAVMVESAMQVSDGVVIVESEDVPVRRPAVNFNRAQSWGLEKKKRRLSVKGMKKRARSFGNVLSMIVKRK